MHTLNIDFKIYTFRARFSPDQAPLKEPHERWRLAHTGYSNPTYDGITA